MSVSPDVVQADVRQDAVTLQRGTLLALAAICALALLFRLPNLLESVWYDELWATRLKLFSLGQLADVALSDVHPPAYPAFMFVWIRVFGDSELAIRAPSLLFGLGTVVLTFLFAARVAGPRSGLVAAFLIAVSPVHIWYSQEARMYSAAMFLTVLGIVALHRADRDISPARALLVAGVALTGAVLAHYYVIAMVAALAVTAAVQPSPHRRRVLAVLVGASLALVVLLLLKLLLAGSIATEVVHLRAFTPAETLRLADWLTTGGTVFRDGGWNDWPYFLLHMAWRLTAATLAVAGLLHIRARYEVRDSLCLALLLVSIPALLLVLPLVGLRATYIERSALPVLPILAIVVAAGLDRLLDARRHRTALLAVCCLIAAVPGMRLHALPDVWTVYKPNPDWRGAADYLRRSGAGGAPIVLFGTSPASALQYYGIEVLERSSWREDVIAARPRPLPRPAPADPLARVKQVLNEVTAYGGARDPRMPPGTGAGEAIYLDGRADCIVEAVLARTGSSRFFVVHNHYWPQGFDQVLGRTVGDGRYPVASRIELKGLSLVEYVAGGWSRPGGSC